MKQFRTFLALLCTIVCSQTILADEVVVDGIKYSLVDSTKQATVVSNNYKGDVVIPQSVTYNGADYAVVALGENCFLYCRDTINITIPEGVVSIGDNCFYNSDITSITIPASVKSIGSQACVACYKLESIIVKEGNSVYDSRDNCNAIIQTVTNTMIAGCKTSTIPGTVTALGDYLFDACTYLSNLVIPEGVVSIGTRCFNQCKSLTNLTIPASVKTIGKNCFMYAGLTSLTVAEGNTVFDSRDNCNAIIQTATNTMVHGSQASTIPATVTALGDNCFYGRSSLSKLIIPESVVSIGASCFTYCKSLTSLTIPASVTNLGSGCFTGCNSMTDLYCNAATPPTVKSKELSNNSSFYKQAVLHVPEASVETYKATSPWSKFSEIVGITTGISSPAAEAADAPALFYGLDGMLLQGEPAKSGIYIREKGGERKKVTVRKN